MIYSRPHSGSSLKEFKATGEIAAPTGSVCEVVEDVDAYPSFMPYMTECRLLKRESDSVITYQRISPEHLMRPRFHLANLQKFLAGHRWDCLFESLGIGERIWPGEKAGCCPH